MKAKQHLIKFILIFLAFIITLFMPKYILADFNIDEFSSTFNSNVNNIADELTQDDEFNDAISNFVKPISTMGTVISIIALILIGIKYMMGSIEEKAEYKQTLTPYLIGVTILFTASGIVQLFVEMIPSLSASPTINVAGGRIITVLSTIGSILSVIVLVALGIKYMGGSIEEKANYKKTLLPYVIGAVLVFAASALVRIIFNVTASFNFS